MRQKCNAFVARVCLPKQSGCFAPANQCNIVTIVREVQLLAIARLFSECRRADAGAKARCETFTVYWRPVFTTTLASPATISRLCWLLPDADRARPWAFVTCSHAALCLTRPTHRPFTTSHNPNKKSRQCSTCKGLQLRLLVFLSCPHEVAVKPSSNQSKYGAQIAREQENTSYTECSETRPACRPGGRPTDQLCRSPSRGSRGPPSHLHGRL